MPQTTERELDLIEAARLVVFEIADFEAMTEEAAAAMRALRKAVSYCRRSNPGIISPHLPKDIVAMVNPEDDGERRIVESYAQTDPESVAEGDFSETGMYDEEGASMEPDDDDVEEGLTPVDLAVAHLEHSGVIEPSSSEYHKGVWYSSDWDTIDFGTGTEEKSSFHLRGFTEEEERQIYRQLKAQRTI